MGDAVKPHDGRIAMMIYSKAKATGKVVTCLAEMGQSDKIIAYCQRAGFSDNYIQMCQQAVDAVKYKYNN